MKKLLLAFCLTLFAMSVQAQETTPMPHTDSLAQLRKGFLSPQFLSQNLGRPYITKAEVEKTFEVASINYRSGITFYDFDDLFVGMKFEGQNDVLMRISFRMFPEEGLAYEKNLMQGFTLYKKHTTSSLEYSGSLTNIEALDGEIRIYRRKAGAGYVYCEVYDGSYLAFDFYLAK